MICAHNGVNAKTGEDRDDEVGTCDDTLGHPAGKKCTTRKSGGFSWQDPENEWLRRESRELDERIRAEQRKAAEPRKNTDVWLDRGTIKRNMGHAKAQAETAAKSEGQPQDRPSSDAVSEKFTLWKIPKYEPCEPTEAAKEAEPEETEKDRPLLLDEKKTQALYAILRGQSYSGAAKTVGVDRRTIYRWRQEPEFQAELARVKSTFKTSLRVRLAALTDDSVASIHEKMDQGHIPTAVQLLQSLDVLDGQPLTSIDGLDDEPRPDAAEFRTTEPQTSPSPGDAPPAAESAKSQTPEDLVDVCDLPIRQQRAIGALLEGKILDVAASIAGVSGWTLQRWLRTDPAFRQVLRSFRQEQLERLRLALLKHCMRAVDVVWLAVKYGRKVPASLAVLRGLGVMT